jgi:hypothetical protein
MLAILIATWAALIAARGTPIGTAMRRWLVEKPAAMLSGIHRQTWLAVLALVVIGFTCSWVIGKEGILLYSMALPELTAALAMVDLGVLVDVAMLLVATASTSGWRAVRTMVSVWLDRSRSARTRRTRRTQRPAANDDGERPGFARAA